MSELRKLIDQITEFETNPKVELTDKTDFLKKLLVRIYSEFLKVEFEFFMRTHSEQHLIDLLKFIKEKE